MSIYEKLLTIQAQIDHFTKDKRGHNYSYTTGDAILSKIRPLMNENGLLLKQEVVDITNERIDYDTKYGTKSEMFTCTKQLFTWIDTETGEKEEVRWAANGMNDWDKGFGSALTYAERYFLLKFFHVPTDGDDPDARQGNESFKKANDDKPWLNEGTEEFNKAKKALSEGYSLSDIRKKYKVSKKTAEALTK